MLTIWNQITTKFYGRSVYGSYVIEGAMLTVKTPHGKKATHLGNSNSHFLAERYCVSWRRKERHRHFRPLGDLRKLGAVHWPELT